MRRFTREEYHKMSSLGFFEGCRTLLLDGVVFEVRRQGNWHSVTLGLVENALLSVFLRGRYWIRSQCPLDLPDGRSEPKPDIAVAPGIPDDYTAHPSTALLVIEVADSSLRLDRRKAHAYASAGVEDYWIIDIAGHHVEVYRHPVAHPREPMGHRYDRIEVLRPGETISPLAAPQATVAVADLLPKHPVPNPDA